jgi:hypothetical protein
VLALVLAHVYLLGREPDEAECRLRDAVRVADKREDAAVVAGVRRVVEQDDARHALGLRG